MEKKQVQTIYTVEATELPKEVLDWCCEHDIATHYDNGLASFWREDDHDNIFIEWFENTYDVKLDKTGHTNILIFGS